MATQPSVAAVAPSVPPNLPYTHFTDQELLDASRNAQNYCMNRSSTQVISNIPTNPNGGRIVALQCRSR